MVRPVPEYSGVEETLRGIQKAMKGSNSHENVATTISFGRVSAEDVTAPEDIPPAPTSHMDGFAVFSADLLGASRDRPVDLRVVGRSELEGKKALRLQRGEAIEVVTGSTVPPGADTVVRSEQVGKLGPRLFVESPQPAGVYVYERGGDVKKGERVVSRGRTIRAQDVGVLLALGILEVKVVKKPKVALIATGSELTDATKPSPGKRADTHSPVLVQLVRAAGGEVVSSEIVPDTRRTLVSRIRAALKAADIVFTMGGTSVGPRDLVGGAVAELSPDALYHGVRLDRGRVTGVAVIRGKPVVMMPGPIQGALNAFLVFGLPLMKSVGQRVDPPILVSGKLSRKWESRRGYQDFVKVVYVKRGSDGSVDPLKGETESLSVLKESDGFLVVPEEVTFLAKGSEVKVELLPGFSFA